MPSTSLAQQHLFGAAAGGAKFPEAEKLRQSMSPAKLKEFASAHVPGAPMHVGPPAPDHILHHLLSSLRPK